MNKVTPEIKKAIKESRKKGLSLVGIGKILGLSPSTIQYHLNEKSRLKAIERAKKNPKRWKGEKKYIREYMANRYDNDPEFRERMQKHSRESWRRRHGKSSNLS